jgi:predicted DNA-binding transcriptional regulator AlpA
MLALGHMEPMEVGMIITHAAAGAVDGLSRSTRERLVAAGLYPRPVRLTAGRVGFVRSEVEAWARERIAGRDAGRAAGEDPIVRATAGRRGDPGHPPACRLGCPHAPPRKEDGRPR